MEAIIASALITLITLGTAIGIVAITLRVARKGVSAKSDNEELLESLEDLEQKIRGLIAIEDTNVSKDDADAAIASINKMFGGVEVVNLDILEALTNTDLYARLDRSATSGKKALKQSL
jgi:hypothetical protein